MTHEFFIVLNDYYSPLAPEGDADWLEGELLVPDAGGSLRIEDRDEKYVTDADDADPLPLARSASVGTGSGTSSATLVTPGTLTVCQLVDPATDYGRTTDDGTVVGFEPDLLDQVAQSMGVESRYVASRDFDALSRGLPLDDGTCDVLAAQLSVTADREQVMAFSEPYRDGQAFAVAPGNTALLEEINAIVTDPSAVGVAVSDWFDD